MGKGRIGYLRRNVRKQRPNDNNSKYFKDETKAKNKLPSKFEKSKTKLPLEI